MLIHSFTATNIDFFSKIAEKYVQVSGRHQLAMACDIETLFLSAQILLAKNCCSILDAGSGLSSLFYCYFFDNVTVVDDNARWADFTKEIVWEFLKQEIEIKSIENIQKQNYDFVSYDYGNMEARIYNFKKIYMMCNRVMYVDDLHINFYRIYLDSLRANSSTTFTLTTPDSYGRYGAHLYV